MGHHWDINRDIKSQNVPLFFNVFGGLQRFYAGHRIFLCFFIFFILKNIFLQAGHMSQMSQNSIKPIFYKGLKRDTIGTSGHKKTRKINYGLISKPQQSQARLLQFD